MVKLSAKAKGKGKAPPQAKDVSHPKSLLEKVTDSRPKNQMQTQKKLDQLVNPNVKRISPKKFKLRDQKSIPVPQSVFAGRRKRDSDEEEESDEEEDDDMMDLGEEDEGIDASFLARMNESDLKRYFSSQNARLS